MYTSDMLEMHNFSLSLNFFDARECTGRDGTRGSKRGDLLRTGPVGAVSYMRTANGSEEVWCSHHSLRVVNSISVYHT